MNKNAILYLCNGDIPACGKDVLSGKEKVIIRMKPRAYVDKHGELHVPEQALETSTEAKVENRKMNGCFSGVLHNVKW